MKLFPDIKEGTMLIWGLLVMTSILHPQSAEELSEDQRKEYNRSKLTVEKVSETSGGMGWYWSIFARRVDTWRAFKGLANQIEAEEFFRITDYVEEANQVKENLEKANGQIVLGVILWAGGAIAAVIPKTETITESAGFFDYTYEEVSYPLLIPGTIASLAGVYLWYQGTLRKLKPVAPYQTAADIADEYNRKLIVEITQ